MGGLVTVASAGYPRAVATSSLLERLELAETHLKGIGKFASARQWCEATPGVSVSYLGTLKTRLRKDPGASAETDKLVALAEATGGAIDPGWLASGTGPPPGGQRWVEVDDRYPSRQVVVTMARELGYSEAAVKGLLAKQLKADQDPGEKFWWKTLRELEATAKRESDFLRKERDDSDTFD